MNKEDALDSLILDEDKNPDIDLLAKILLKYLKFTKSGEKNFIPQKIGKKFWFISWGGKLFQ